MNHNYQQQKAKNNHSKNNLYTPEDSDGENGGTSNVSRSDRALRTTGSDQISNRMPGTTNRRGTSPHRRGTSPHRRPTSPNAHGRRKSPYRDRDTTKLTDGQILGVSKSPINGPRSRTSLSSATSNRSKTHIDTPRNNLQRRQQQPIRPKTSEEVNQEIDEFLSKSVKYDYRERPIAAATTDMKKLDLKPLSLRPKALHSKKKQKPHEQLHIGQPPRENSEELETFFVSVEESEQAGISNGRVSNGTTTSKPTRGGSLASNQISRDETDTPSPIKIQYGPDHNMFQPHINDVRRSVSIIRRYSNDPHSPIPLVFEERKHDTTQLEHEPSIDRASAPAPVQPGLIQNGSIQHGSVQHGSLNRASAPGSIEHDIQRAATPTTMETETIGDDVIRDRDIIEHVQLPTPSYMEDTKLSPGRTSGKTSITRISDTGSDVSPYEDDDALSLNDDDIANLNEDDLLGGDIDLIDTIDDDNDQDEDEEAESTTTGSSSSSSSFIYPTTDAPLQPALIPSFFHNCGPVINFVTENEALQPHPYSVRKLLRWKMSEITPLVVRRTIQRSGFKKSKKPHDWMGYWGKHMKSQAFKAVKAYQKVNHFPGSFELGRKDRLWRNISKMAKKHGKNEFSFLPQTFILPWDRKFLKAVWDENPKKQRFIVKPPACARGIGVKVIGRWNQVPTSKAVIVQRYLEHPFLINDTKFDMRFYVYISNMDPLTIYLYEDGLARFATVKYSSLTSNLKNRYMHLTNYSVNKKSELFEQNDDANVAQGHKWTLTALWSHLSGMKINVNKIKAQIKDIIIKTLISVDHYANSLIKSNCRRSYCCHEVFGFDIILDSQLKPWILEVNVSPSLHSNSQLDKEVKGGMVKDMMNIAGFKVPEKKLAQPKTSAENLSGTDLPAPGVSKYASQTGVNLTDKASYTQDKRKYLAEVTAETRSKHRYFATNYKRLSQPEMTAFMLERLTVNDIRVLCELEDEFDRKGKFERIYPCVNKKYLRFFEVVRYNNVLMHVWESKHFLQRAQGVSFLQDLCKRGENVQRAEDNETEIDWDYYVSKAVVGSKSVIDTRRRMQFRIPVGGFPRSRKSEINQKTATELAKSSISTPDLNAANFMFNSKVDQTRLSKILQSANKVPQGIRHTIATTSNNMTSKNNMPPK